MGAAHFTELVAWQLSSAFKVEVYTLTADPRVARDIHFCAQIRDSAASVPSNIAEGFARFSHREFARYLVIARGSLMETQNHLRDAADRGYLDKRGLDRLWALSVDALAATTALLRYLQRHDGPGGRR